jgi:hypothetical protein
MFELDVETKLIIGSTELHGPWPSKASSTLSYLLSNSSEFLSPKIWCHDPHYTPISALGRYRNGTFHDPIFKSFPFPSYVGPSGSCFSRSQQFRFYGVGLISPRPVSTTRTRRPYLCPPERGWPSYTPQVPDFPLSSLLRHAGRR